MRFIGAGAIAVSALWTLAKLAKPVATGLTATLANARRRGDIHPTDKDLSPLSIMLWTLGCLIVIVGLVLHIHPRHAARSRRRSGWR